MKSHLLKGEFDLHITDYCNLHCDGCIVLDYQQSGQVTNEKLSLKDVKDIIWELEKRKLRLEQLKIYDLEKLKEVGYCNGVENYNLQLYGREPC